MSTGRVSKIVGTLIQVHQQCTNCSYTRTWASQPYIKQMPVGNLLLSGAILYSGSLPRKVLRLFAFLKVPCISESTYHRHQANYTIPIVISTWKREQAGVISKLKAMKGGLDLAGDGRSDSPGHSAKYGGYNIIEQRLNKVLDIQLVQVNYDLLRICNI